ncbi:hypothetical protein KQI65_14400 [bacterium]|nr:hypothetical protein [bacterium]
MSMHGMLHARLRKTWLWMALPPFIALTISETLRGMEGFRGWHVPGQETLEILLFIFSASASLALPILYRSMFARAHRDRSSITPTMYYRYANNSIVLALLSLWVMVIASILNFTPFFFIGIFLMCLYAGYTQYPTHHRIKADSRIFRVET